MPVQINASINRRVESPVQYDRKLVNVLIQGFRDFVQEFAPRFGRGLGQELPKTISKIAILTCTQLLTPRGLVCLAIAYRTIHQT